MNLLLRRKAQANVLYQADNVQFQTVHTGTFVLKATTTNGDHKGSNGQPASIEITFDVEAPMSLGDPSSGNHRYDGLISYYADKYGIPPQYIKSQAYNESGLNANAFRYELRTIDKQNVFARPESFWHQSDKDYYLYRLPRGQGGSILTDADVARRSIYGYIASMDLSLPPPAWPYVCAPWTASSADDPEITIWSLYQSDNGWQDYMWPAVNYPGHLSPCAPRQGWIQDLGWHEAKFYWVPGMAEEQVGPPPPIYFWLLDNQGYIAQTAICSSYGLMQVLYTTAVETQEWRKGEGGAARHPADLLLPDVSLDLGVGYDAKVSIRKRLFEGSFDALGQYQTAIVLAFSYYNSNNAYHVNDYGRPIVSQSGAFKPY
jgi:hypothetical protein